MEVRSGYVCFPVRRALLLRAALGFGGKRENDRMDMEPGLMAAFLEVSACAPARTAPDSCVDHPAHK